MGNMVNQGIKAINSLKMLKEHNPEGGFGF